MLTWFLTFIVFLLVIIAMAVGVLLSRKPIAGSCGGLNRLGLKKDCPICGDQSERKISARTGTSFHDATLSKPERKS